VARSTIAARAAAQLKGDELRAGDAPIDAGPLASDLSGAMEPHAIEVAMRKVADWQNARVQANPSQNWTFATLYVGLLSASEVLHDSQYRDMVMKVAQHYDWTLGPRKTHADDQAIGQVYLELNREDPAKANLQPLRDQFDAILQIPDDPARPVWWWCDALFMAPPVWSGLSQATHDPAYLNYMDHEWHVTADLLWDAQEHLFFRDQSYFDKREKNGRKIFWSRGNGWVMGGLVQVLERMPAHDPRRPFYVDKLQKMAATIMKLQGNDGLWRPGLLDAENYPNPEVSGSAFFIYAMTWGVDHQLLDQATYLPVIRRGWAGLVSHIYASGRLGCIQPIGAAPGDYTPSSSYVFGTGAFLLAGSEVHGFAESIAKPLRQASSNPHRRSK
jgi:unsaturated rhamnogalacturonyl hydrolase